MALKRHIEKTDRDIKQQQFLEGQLKVEIANLKQKHFEAEELVQSMRQQITASIVFQRQKEMEVQALIRENRGLQGSLQMIQQGVIEGVNEIQLFKE